MSVLDTVGARYNKAVEYIVRAIPSLDHRQIPAFSRWPRQDGSPHVEAAGSTLCYVVTERGNELERRKTDDPEELLYWLVEGAAFSAACDWEVHHRRPNEDSRRQLFAKELELLHALSPPWAARRQQDIEKTLASNPFNDRL